MSEREQMEPSQTSTDEAISVLQRFNLQGDTALVEAIAQAIEAAFRDGYEANQMEVNPSVRIPLVKEKSDPAMEESISTEQLMRFLKLAEELQLHQNQHRKIEIAVLMQFIQDTHEGREESIKKLENWLNATWRTGKKPSEISYSELINRISDRT